MLRRLPDDNEEVKMKQHNLSYTRFYTIWRGMKKRCLNKKAKEYKRYGGRGINICDGWLKFIGFKEDMYKSYLEHVKRYGEKNTSIERINNYLGYYKNNCKWATQYEQTRNTRRNVNITYEGETLCAMDWSKKYNIRHGLITWRLKKGLSKKDILKQPISKSKRKFITYNNKSFNLYI